MKQILPPMKACSSICGKQKETKGVPLRLTKHFAAVPCDEGTLLYHTLTGELVLVSTNCESEITALAEKRFMVPEAFNDRAYADEVLRIIRMLHPAEKKKTGFTILTTTDCNARCFYCYELGIPRVPMSPETARKAGEYIARVCDGKEVSLRWFGGEPLYNREPIEIICEILRKKEIPFTSSMVSNGYYLDRETSIHARDKWNLEKIQITVDGTEKTYNRIKAYIDQNASPYQRVMTNIRDAAEAGIRVSIRMNMDAENAEDLLALADELAIRFQGNANIEAYAAVLHQFTGKVHEHESLKEKLKNYRAIQGRLAAYGMLKNHRLSRKPRINSCMADDDSSETILPDGRIGRCEHFSEEMISGRIDDDTRNETVIRSWKELLRVPECEDCALYPICRKLKKCEWHKDGCTESDRMIELENLKEKILLAYKEYQDGEKDETEE